MRPDDLREEDDGAARPDHDVPDLEGLVAERDRVRAEVERLRREKREACVCSMELWPVEHRVSVQLSGGF